MKYNIIPIATLTFLLFVLNACQNVYTDPGSSNRSQVVSSPSGLYSLANGLCYKYSVGRQGVLYNAITGDGLSTLQLTVLNAGNTDERDLGIGGTAVQDINVVVTNLWTQSHLIRNNADIILNNVSIVSDESSRAALVGYASIFKALALGNLAQFWKQSPIESKAEAHFVSSTEVLNNAIEILEKAKQSVENKNLDTKLLVVGIDIPNTINALLARYYLETGNYNQAIVAANHVDLKKKSVFNFNDIARNPIYDVTFTAKNVTEPKDNFGLSGSSANTLANDGRVAFFYNSDNKKNKGNASFFSANSVAIPVYRPGEMFLIKAEAYARLSMFQEAVKNLDSVLKKNDDVYSINANLPAYSGPNTQEDILSEIYRNRTIELFLSGTHLADIRRFNRPASEYNLLYYPYPSTERLNNSKTPPNP